MNILREFYYGNITPHFSTIERGSEYDKSMEIMADRAHKLLKRLQGSDRQLLDEFANADTAEKFLSMASSWARCS